VCGKFTGQEKDKGTSSAEEDPKKIRSGRLLGDGKGKGGRKSEKKGSRRK
jgi:hypothetical protein